MPSVIVMRRGWAEASSHTMRGAALSPSAAFLPLLAVHSAASRRSGPSVSTSGTRSSRRRKRRAHAHVGLDPAANCRAVMHRPSFARISRGSGATWCSARTGGRRWKIGCLARERPLAGALCRYWNAGCTGAGAGAESFYKTGLGTGIAERYARWRVWRYQVGRADRTRLTACAEPDGVCRRALVPRRRRDRTCRRLRLRGGRCLWGRDYGRVESLVYSGTHSP